MAGSRIVVPQLSRNPVLRSIHEGHQGETKSLLCAKSAAYWRGIYKEIQNLVKHCSACREFENAQQKCPMILMEVPSQPWHTIGADSFQFKGKWHLLVTDYYSKAPFVRYVPNTGAQATIRAMKGIFAENGIPAKIASDNGPHFAAHEYSAFAKKWGFNIILSSPEYPQGHALIVRHIQTIKKCMYKCDASGYDFDLAMLVLRSTPLELTFRVLLNAYNRDASEQPCQCTCRIHSLRKSKRKLLLITIKPPRRNLSLPLDNR